MSDEEEKPASAGGPGENGGGDSPPPTPSNPSGSSGPSGPSGPSDPPRQNRFFSAGFAILAAITLLALFWTRNGGVKPVELKWHPEFTSLVDFGFVDEVEIVRGDEVSVGKGSVAIAGPGTAHDSRRKPRSGS